MNAVVDDDVDGVVDEEDEIFVNAVVDDDVDGVVDEEDELEEDDNDSSCSCFNRLFLSFSSAFALFLAILAFCSSVNGL